MKSKNKKTKAARAPRSRTFKSGDTLRLINHPGKHREQVFTLLNPVKRLGDENGGRWWVKFLATGNKTTIAVDGLPRVGDAWLKRFRLK